MKIIVPAYSKTYWALKPFTHLFNKYWKMENATILHYAPIPFSLPNNFELKSIYYKDYPRDKWANGVIEYLETIDDEVVVLLLEDYWLAREVNTSTMRIIETFLESNPNILRVDLTTDRLYAGGCRDVGYLNWLDLVEAPQSQYQMSLQAGMWRRDNLLNVLTSLNDNARSSWDVEIQGTSIINEHYDKFRVLGTRQNPLRYVNGINDSSGINTNLNMMSDTDKKYVKKWIEENAK